MDILAGVEVTKEVEGCIVVLTFYSMWSPGTLTGSTVNE